MAARIADRVSGRMPSRPLIARETVIGETPTFAATSLIVGRRARRPALFTMLSRLSPADLLDALATDASRSVTRYSLSVWPTSSLGRSLMLGTCVPSRQKGPGMTPGLGEERSRINTVRREESRMAGSSWLGMLLRGGRASQNLALNPAV